MCHAEVNYHSLMRTTLEHAEQALKVNEVPIAAILYNVETGEIESKSHNLTNLTLNGTKHAEFEIYSQLRTKYPQNHLQIWSKSILVVTVEPCIMCASLLNQLKVQKVIFGCANDRFGGNGSIFTIQRSYDAVPGVLDHQAIDLLRRFYVNENDKSPDKIGKKNRKLNQDSYPQLKYDKYMTRDQFVSIWGPQYGFVYDQNLTLEFDAEGALITKNIHHIEQEEVTCAKRLREV